MKASSNKSTIKNRFSIKILNDKLKIGRQYLFLSNSEDIANAIYRHTNAFIGSSQLSREVKGALLQHLVSLCHKVNMVKYHLRRYEELEAKFRKQFETDIQGQIKEGTFLVEECELTAEYESFLFQMKATLDVLVSFLNPIYRKDNRNPLKKQVTFEKKGLNVIKDLERYSERHPEASHRLSELIKHLKTECRESEYYEDGSINWLLTLISQRDIVAHEGKSRVFAFQITNRGDEKTVYPPRLSPEQSMMDAFRLAYENLLVFIQDFIALTLGPYLRECFVSQTFQEEEVKTNAPKWYIMLRGLRQFGLKSLRHNPIVVKQFCEFEELPVDPVQCLEMHVYYSSFYK